MENDIRFILTMIAGSFAFIVFGLLFGAHPGSSGLTGEGVMLFGFPVFIIVCVFVWLCLPGKRVSEEKKE